MKQKHIFRLLLVAVMTVTLLSQGLLFTYGDGEQQDSGASTEPCGCTETCTSDNVNKDCPVCGEEGADLSLCLGADSVKGADDQTTQKSTTNSKANKAKKKGPSIASVGPWTNETTSTTYAELSTAVSEATAGDKISLTEDATISESVTVDKEVTIDLGGFEATSTVADTSTTGNTFLVENGGGSDATERYPAWS